MRRLTSALLGLGCIIGGVLTAMHFQQKHHRRTAEQAALAPAVQATLATGNGNLFATQMLETLERRFSVVAKIRQKVHVDGNDLTGSGGFWQQGVGNQRRTRWVMQTLVADSRSSLMQVYDSRYLWTDLTLPSERRVTRVDLMRLRRELAARPPTGAITTDSPAAQPSPHSGLSPDQVTRAARGGLVQLLSELVERFDFDEPRPTRFGDQSVFALVGHWKPGSLKRLAPELADTGDWPPPLPHHVLLLVGQTDLFPYAIEYRSSQDAKAASGEGALATVEIPLTRYELFDVQFAAKLDSQQLFQFTPGEAHWSDITLDVLNRLAPPAVPLDTTAAPPR